MLILDQVAVSFLLSPLQEQQELALGEATKVLHLVLQYLRCFVLPLHQLPHPRVL
jgi:hypothetical protein